VNFGRRRKDLKKWKRKIWIVWSENPQIEGKRMSTYKVEVRLEKEVKIWNRFERREWIWDLNLPLEKKGWVWERGVKNALQWRELCMGKKLIRKLIFYLCHSPSLGFKISKSTLWLDSAFGSFQSQILYANNIRFFWVQIFIRMFFIKILI
jgi:hypothetical protein